MNKILGISNGNYIDTLLSMCWRFDIHIFHDKDKERIGHLNIHHTVKTAVVPNIKATFSSS